MRRWRFQHVAKHYFQVRFHGLCGTVRVEPKCEITSDTSLLYPARSVSEVKDVIIPVKIANLKLFPVNLNGRDTGFGKNTRKGKW